MRLQIRSSAAGKPRTLPASSQISSYPHPCADNSWRRRPTMRDRPRENVARMERLRSAPAAEPHTDMLVIALREGGVRRLQTALSTEALPLTHERS
jgi:hypothetical protein